MTTRSGSRLHYRYSCSFPRQGDNLAENESIVTVVTQCQTLAPGASVHVLELFGCSWHAYDYIAQFCQMHLRHCSEAKAYTAII